MNLTGITPILNVADVPVAIAWFEKLGWKRCWTFNDAGLIDNAADKNTHGPAAFAAVGCGDFEIFLCHDSQGSRGNPNQKYETDGNTPGVWMSWWFKTPAEVDEIHALALKHNMTITWPPTDEPWGARECRIVSPDGHTIRLSAPNTP